jgi:hypothetical protein
MIDRTTAKLLVCVDDKSGEFITRHYNWFQSYEPEIHADILEDPIPLMLPPPAPTFWSSLMRALGFKREVVRMDERQQIELYGNWIK